MEAGPSAGLQPQTVRRNARDDLDAVPEVAEPRPRWLDRRIAPSGHDQPSPEADQRREYRLVRGGDRTEPDELAAAARAAVLNPGVWTKYRFEYVSPVAWMTISPDLVWTLDFSLANRGRTEERFALLMTEFHFAPDQPSFFSDDITSFPGRVFLVNSSFVGLGGVDDEGWWARIYTTSRNLVPSIHFYVDSADGSESPSHPDVYFGRGDFEVFELPGVFVPPVIGPVEQ